MRISREQMYMDICEVLARRATCFRGNSGALIVKDNDIISCGYNGPPSGDVHCKGTKCELTDNGGCMRSLHAETNAIDRALCKEGILSPFGNRRYWLKGEYTLYTLHAPCPDCADAIIKSGGIEKVYYRHPYRLIEGLEKLLWPNHPHIEVFRITQSGMIIDQRSNQLCET